MQVKQLVAQRYPGMEVEGSHYPVAKLRELAAQAVSVLRNAGLVLALGGDVAFRAANMEVPQWYTNTIGQNKFGTCMGECLGASPFVSSLVMVGRLQQAAASTPVSLHWSSLYLPPGWCRCVVYRQHSVQWPDVHKRL